MSSTKVLSPLVGDQSDIFAPVGSSSSNSYQISGPSSPLFPHGASSFANGCLMSVVTKMG